MCLLPLHGSHPFFVGRRHLFTTDVPLGLLSCLTKNHTMPCLKCDGVIVDTDGEGHNRSMPSMSRHKCAFGGCDHFWFTCNAKCRPDNGLSKRRFKEGGICQPSKAARRHDSCCHKTQPSGMVVDHEPIDDVIVESPMESEAPTVDGGSFSSQIPVVEDDSHLDFLAAGDGELVDDVLDSDLFCNHLLGGIAVEPLAIAPTVGSRVLSPVEQFDSHMVAGNALLAASMIVTQALFQTPALSATPLPVANVMLFLCLSKLIISTGQLQQANLSKVLLILHPHAEKCESSWAPMPCTVSGFASRITNVTNSNSLVSILPIPRPRTLGDGHGCTPFREVLKHALLMKRFDARETKDPKWKSLASSKKFKAFLQRIAGRISGHSIIQQTAVGIVVWTDGWDTSTGTKSNRSPMPTGTVTLLFVDVASCQVVGIATYPNMGGPGKTDHGSVFQCFREDMESFEMEGSDRVFQSANFVGDVEVRTEILFVVQLGSSGVDGGNNVNGRTNFPISVDINFQEPGKRRNACLQQHFPVGIKGDLPPCQVGHSFLQRSTRGCTWTRSPGLLVGVVHQLQVMAICNPFGDHCFFRDEVGGLWRKQGLVAVTVGHLE
jgi:hypothetical protein